MLGVGMVYELIQLLKDTLLMLTEMKMHNLGQAVPFLEIYLTNELALVQDKASLYLLIGNGFEDILSEKCQVQFTKNSFCGVFFVF